MTARSMRRAAVALASVLACTAAVAVGPFERARAAFVGSAANGTSTLGAATLAPPTGFDAVLSCSLGTWRADLTWTATTSTWADGYTLERWRGTTLEASWSITPATTASASDTGGGLLGGQTYTYRLRAREGSTWVSSDATDSATVPLLCL